MVKNVGSVDRYFRIVLGIIVIIPSIITLSWWGLIGLALLLTAGLSFCPLYAVLGLSTSKK
jgi:hypothetical protein